MEAGRHVSSVKDQEPEERAQKMEAAPRARARFFVVLCLSVVLASSEIASAGDTKAPAFQFSKNPQIQQVKPRKPVKIKLHRNGKGEYQWDISGDNPDDIVRADERLRKLLKVEDNKDK
ncbi:MAG: hypothetical protein AB1805_10770 [Nitrospirota bacterium]